MKSMISILALALSSSAAMACSEAEQTAALLGQGDLDKAAILFEEVDLSPDCSDAWRVTLAERLADDTLRAALVADLGDRKRLYEQSLYFDETWGAYLGLADIAAAAGDTMQEATLLQLAINIMNDKPDRLPATEDEIRTLFDRATVAVRLAGGYVDIPKTRSGEIGGILTGNIRGFVVEEVPLPITFEHDSTDFTADGGQYAEMLAQRLLAEQPDRISLIGHTDPTGSDEYNMTLSIERAEALRAFLVSRGFTGAVVVDGRGESEMPDPTLEAPAGSDAHFRLARRVVMQR